MKKMNKKGFTLIELLAVIVVLAIILVITIPTVLGSLSSARQNAFDASANSAAEWFEKQYANCKMADTTLAPVDTTNFTGTAPNCTVSSTNLKADQLEAAGLDSSNYKIVDSGSGGSTVEVKSNGRACVTLIASDSGDFASVTTKTATSGGCE